MLFVVMNDCLFSGVALFVYRFKGDCTAFINYAVKEGMDLTESKLTAEFYLKSNC